MLRAMLFATLMAWAPLARGSPTELLPRHRCDQDCQTPMQAACAIQIDVAPACCDAAKNISSESSSISSFCSACTGTANKNIAADVESMCQGDPSSKKSLSRGVLLLHDLSFRSEAVEFRHKLLLSGGSTDACAVQDGDCSVQVNPQYKAIFKGINATSSTCCSSLAPILANSGPISDSDKVAFCHGCQEEMAENVDLESLYQVVC
mmetsp:Transcript_115037/g.298256  ORF Transcript_115037/g.298256 Transcript_115037/m.298256 type:complete len:206 (+) Transcript_115037:73-690(+)